MNKTIVYKESQDGRSSVAIYKYLPDSQPRGVVQIVHGMAEYMDRYDDFARFLTDSGLAVYANDHLGHGRTAEHAQLGFMAEEQGWRYMLGDVRRTAEFAAAETGGLPHVLLGHSMGSLIARIYLAKHGQELAGCLLLGLVEKPKHMAISEIILNAQIRRHGPEGISEFLQKTAFGSHNRRIPNAASPNAWICSDEEVVAAYDQDPLCGFTFSTSGFRDLLSMSKIVFAKNYYAKIPKNVPIMIAVGSDDPVAGYGKGSRAEAAKMKTAGAQVIYKEYSGMRHEILNERGKATVYADLLSFVNSCINQ